jgi:hypothetical protein
LKTQDPLCGGTSMARASLNLSADDIAWLKAHAKEVSRTFGAEFADASDRFTKGQVLLDRFNAAIETVLKLGRGHFSAVDEADYSRDTLARRC